jgi:pumilio family protein 6
MQCAEFYGREYVLFDGVTQQSANLGNLSSLLDGVSAAKKRSVLVYMEKALAPIMEKAILHPAMVHRLIKVRPHKWPAG